MKIVNKVKFIRSMAILVLLILALFNISVAKSNTEAETTSYTVCKGETLWNIAEQNKEENQDTREYIYQLKKINNNDLSTIYAGQMIKIIKGQ